MRAFQKMLIWGVVGAGLSLAIGLAYLAIGGFCKGYMDGFGAAAPVRPNIPPGFRAACVGALAQLVFFWFWTIPLSLLGGMFSSLGALIVDTLFSRRATIEST